MHNELVHVALTGADDEQRVRACRAHRCRLKYEGQCCVCRATVVREQTEFWMNVRSTTISYQADCAVSGTLADEVTFLS